MRIAIFGTGGVGGYFGGRLAQAGEDVTFIARGEHLDAIRTSGLSVESVKGGFTVTPARTASDPTAVGPVDVVLVCTKAWQVPDAAVAIRPMVGSDTVVIPLQNGVEAGARLAEVLGRERVAEGLCRISSFVAAPGRIRHAGVEPYIAFNFPGGQPGPRLEALRAAFAGAGVNAEIPADILSAVWAKFVFIASISGVGAVTRAPVGIQRTVPETRRMLETALREAAAVGRALGVALGASLEAKTMELIDTLPEATVASMSRDIIDGRPSELESQNGSVVRLGREAGVPTPVHEFLYASLLPLELRARGGVKFQ